MKIKHDLMAISLQCGKSWILAALFFLPFHSFADPGDIHWTRIVGDFEQNHYSGNDIIQNVDGGYTWVSVSRKPISPTTTLDTLWIHNTDSAGQTLWVRGIHLEGHMLRTFDPMVHQLDDGGFIVTGSTVGETYYLGDRMFQMRLDDVGNEIWIKYYGPDVNHGYHCLGSKQTPEGGFLLAGYTANVFNPPPAGQFPPLDPFVVMTDANGDTLWTRHYFEEQQHNYYYIYSVDFCEDGNYILSGVRSFIIPDEGPGYSQLLLMKIDPDGDVLWTRFYGEQTEFSFHAGYTVRTTPDGGFAVVGEYFNENRVPGIRLLKTDSAGDEEWNLFFSNDEAPYTTYSMILTNDSGYAVSGMDYREVQVDPGGPPSLFHSAFILKCDSSGEIEWTRTYEEELGLYSYARRIIQAADNAFVLAGNTQEEGSHQQAFIMKVSSDSTMSDVYESVVTPQAISLVSCYPNPFNGTTFIDYTVGRQGTIEVAIYDILGKKVATLAEGRKLAGRYTTQWDASGVASGVFLVRVSDGQHNNVQQKITLIK